MKADMSFRPEIMEHFINGIDAEDICLFSTWGDASSHLRKHMLGFGKPHEYPLWNIIIPDLEDISNRRTVESENKMKRLMDRNPNCPTDLGEILYKKYVAVIKQNALDAKTKKWFISPKDAKFYAIGTSGVVMVVERKSLLSAFIPDFHRVLKGMRSGRSPESLPKKPKKYSNVEEHIYHEIFVPVVTYLRWRGFGVKPNRGAPRKMDDISLLASRVPAARTLPLERWLEVRCSCGSF